MIVFRSFVLAVFFLTYSSIAISSESRNERVISELKSALNLTVRVTTSNSKNGYSYGTGFLISPKGYIATSGHLIKDADKIFVRRGGQRSPATLLFVDEATDLAILKVHADMLVSNVLSTAQDENPFPLLNFSYNFKLGEPIYVIGNRDAKGLAVSKGIISSLHQVISQTGDFPTVTGAVLLDVSAIEGFSGGPVINSAGEIVGMTTAISKIAGNSTGFTYAVPLRQTKRSMESIIAQELDQRPTWGVGIYELVEHPSLRQHYNQGAGDVGLLVALIEDGSPFINSELVGSNRTVPLENDRGKSFYIVGGDVITEIDGVSMRTVSDLSYSIASKEVGDTMRVTFYRGGIKRDIIITL